MSQKVEGFSLSQRIINNRVMFLLFGFSLAFFLASLIIDGKMAIPFDNELFILIEAPALVVRIFTGLLCISSGAIFWLRKNKTPFWLQLIELIVCFFIATITIFMIHFKSLEYRSFTLFNNSFSQRMPEEIETFPKGKINIFNWVSKPKMDDSYPINFFTSLKYREKLPDGLVCHYGTNYYFYSMNMHIASSNFLWGDIESRAELCQKQTEALLKSGSSREKALLEGNYQVFLSMQSMFDGKYDGSHALGVRFSQLPEDLKAKLNTIFPYDISYSDMPVSPIDVKLALGATEGLGTSIFLNQQYTSFRYYHYIRLMRENGQEAVLLKHYLKPEAMPVASSYCDREMYDFLIKNKFESNFVSILSVLDTVEKEELAALSNTQSIQNDKLNNCLSLLKEELKSINSLVNADIAPSYYYRFYQLFVQNRLKNGFDTQGTATNTLQKLLLPIKITNDNVDVWLDYGVGEIDSEKAIFKPYEPLWQVDYSDVTQVYHLWKSNTYKPIALKAKQLLERKTSLKCDVSQSYAATTLSCQ